MGMAEELREAPEAVRRQKTALAMPVGELVKRLKERPPRLVVTCARGSSAHAATFAKHLIELNLGIPVAAMARHAGALTAAVVNASDSPLAAACEFVLPIGAGPELSVAATKSFVATTAALLRLVAAWTDDDRLPDALDRLSERLAAATYLDWSLALDGLVEADSLITIGRGPTLAIAREAALKLKEIANRHAEAFSGAEFLHGPVALVEPRYPVLMFMPDDEAAEGLLRLAADLAGKGAALFIAGAPRDKRQQDKRTGMQLLPTLIPDHPETDAVCLIQSFYAMMVRLAERLGIDPERPRHLQKVTRTR